jgi:hypothetical protein
MIKSLLQKEVVCVNGGICLNRYIRAFGDAMALSGTTAIAVAGAMHLYTRRYDHFCLPPDTPDSITTLGSKHTRVAIVVILSTVIGIGTFAADAYSDRNV